MPPPTTKISLQSLSLPHPLLAPSIWTGPPKPQPALLNITLTLRGAGFASAASADRLDSSTIHYGHLAKKIRSSVAEGMHVSDVVRVVESVVVGMDEGGQTVERMRVEVCLAKATNYGDCVRVVRESGGKREQGQWAFEVEGVKVMVLVGVNSYEREGRQPILVGFGVSGLREGEFIEEKAFGLEREVVDIIETTSFETLETLIEHVYSALRKRILDEHFPRAQFWINIAKPRAIAFADAPVVEIVRDVPCSGNSNGGTIAAAAQPVLCIRKPYQG